MPQRIRLVRHEAVPQTGSFEVKYPDGRPSDFFYFEDEPSRRLRAEQMTRAQALAAAQAKARQAQHDLDKKQA